MKPPDPKIRGTTLLAKIKSKKKMSNDITESLDTTEDPEESNADLTQNTDGEEVQKRRVGRSKRKVKAIDPIMAEKEIQGKIGQAPEAMEKEVLFNMTASDLSAQALDYILHIETIRTKCGRMQGGLSGKLKNRLSCLQDLVRALQNKAESTGDPKYLRAKISQLNEELEKERKYNKKEEAKRKKKKKKKKKKKEFAELQEVVKELRKENKSIKEEMQKIRQSLEKENKEKENLQASLQTNLQTNLQANLQINLKTSLQTNLKARKYSPSIPSTSGVPSTSYLPERKSHDKSSSGEWSPLDRRGDSNFHWNLRSKLAPARLQEKDSWPVDGEPWPTFSFKGNSHDESQTEVKKRKLDEETWPSLPQRKPTSLPTKGIKVIENIQLVSPRSEQKVNHPKEEWTEIGKRGKIKKGQRKEKEKVEEKNNQPHKIDNKGGQQRIDFKKERKKLPRTAAISIKGKSTGFSYAEALRKVRSGVSLQALEIQTPKVRKGMNGATIIEISGEGNANKADKLALERLVSSCLMKR
ncbi:eukaryotic translation initiation factor 5B-like [Camponotus floridanus]|uniref:eukaryotic translation initiation factor 5B-like n=1 Tax=Camponotus floridanus TaxID=104421 RepID=UPI000DC6AF51|nr:eukaryotic translation initiation factor 5B-like [Camponotus floridanus]